MTAATKPTFHQVNLKATRLQEMIDWYGTVVGAEVVFADIHAGAMADKFAPERSPVQIPSEG